MTFQSPQWLALLVVVPLLVAAYVVRDRRRAADRDPARRLAEPHLLPALVPRPPGRRRHVPVAALGVAAAAGLVAVAGPTASVADRRDAAQLVVALDVSVSMAETDVAPDRLEAARRAAAEFVAGLPSHVAVGVVTFAGTADVLVAPTEDRDAVRTALQGLQRRPATAIGEAVLTGLATLGRGGEDGDRRVPRRIVLLSDGANTSGRPVAVAAAAAAAAGVPVDTIAFGTDTGPLADGQPSIDREALEDLATTTGGRAYEAGSAEALRSAYERIGARSVVEPQQREVADWLLGAALLSALAGAATALPWFRRLPL